MKGPSRCASVTGRSTSVRTMCIGAVLDSLLLHTRRNQHLPRRLWPLVKSQAQGALASWREPDQGIWEARGAPQHYVSSKLMGWVALDRASKLAGIREDLALQKAWAEAADEIRADILEHGVSDRGVLRQHYETDALDASTLLRAIFGFLPGTDERMRNTVDAISSELPSTVSSCATSPARPTMGCRAKRAPS